MGRCAHVAKAANESPILSHYPPKVAAAVVIANMIGTGVFTSLGFQLVDIQSPPVILLLWIVGGISASMGAMVGGEGDDEIVIFEALHGDAPDLVGKNAANPLPFLLPAIYMLEHLNQDETAARIQSAVEAVIADGVVTADLGGAATTSQMTEAIIANLKA